MACADGDSCYAICGSRAGCSNIAYPTLVLNLMPIGESIVLQLLIFNSKYEKSVNVTLLLWIYFAKFVGGAMLIR